MLLIAGGMGLALDPEFSLGNALNPYAMRMALAHSSPLAVAQRLARAGLEAAALGLPQRLRRVFDLIDANGVEVHLRAAELDPLVRRVERIGNRLVMGVIAAAFIRGVGELASADRKRWRAWEGPLMGVGLGAVGALATYLAWTARGDSRGP